MLGLLQPVLGRPGNTRHRRGVFHRPPRDRVVDGGLGPGAAGAGRRGRVEDRRRRQRVFATLGDLITRLLDFAGIGAAFVFGPLGDGAVWARVMQGALGPEGARYATIFAFQVLLLRVFIEPS